MLRPPPKFVYVRWIGLLATLIPMSALLILYLFSPAPLEGLMYSIVVIAPLLLFSYYLDLLIRLIPMPERIRHPFPKVWISWIIAFPTARLGISEPILARLIGSTINIDGRALLAMLFLGAVYGVFFYTAYMVLLRIYVRRKLSKGALPEEFY